MDQYMDQYYVALALARIDSADYYRNDGADPDRAAHEMQLANVYAQLAIAEQQRRIADAVVGFGELQQNVAIRGSGD